MARRSAMAPCSMGIPDTVPTAEIARALISRLPVATSAEIALLANRVALASQTELDKRSRRAQATRPFVFGATAPSAPPAAATPFVFGASVPTVAKATPFAFDAIASAWPAPPAAVPNHLDALSDDLVLRVFVRAPFATHGTLHAVNRRLKSLLRSDTFSKLRLDSGWAEHGLVVAGGDDDRIGELADCKMLSHGRWRPMPPMRRRRSGACSVVIDNEMWVMGGTHNERCRASVEVYSPKTNSWRSRASMRQRRWGAIAGVLGGRLIVAGGGCDRGTDEPDDDEISDDDDDDGNLSSVEAYTPAVDQWSPLPPMPYSAFAAAACVLNGRLYVIGGIYNNKLQVLERTDENEFVWTVKADLPMVAGFEGGPWLSHAAAVVYEGKIWLMGGTQSSATTINYRESSASVFTYDADADEWETGPPLPSPMSNCTATVINGGTGIQLRSWLDMSSITGPDGRELGRGIESCDRVFYYEAGVWSMKMERGSRRELPVAEWLLLG